MKKRSESIKPVLNISEQAESKAAQHYARHQENHQQALQKRDELKNYLKEYSARAQASNGEAISPAQMQDNRAFLSRLSDIIRIQEDVVVQQERHLEASRQEWLSCRQQAKSLDKLALDYQAQEQRHAEQIEQRSSDELSSLRHSWLQRQRIEGM